jgi:hypothetical protein
VPIQTGCGVGWRGRIRTIDLLIQRRVPESGLADAVLNVIRRSAALGFRVSQVPIRKRVRCSSEEPDESRADDETVEERSELSRATWVAELRERLILDLPNPLAVKVEFGTDLR